VPGPDPPVGAPLEHEPGGRSLVAGHVRSRQVEAAGVRYVRRNTTTISSGRWAVSRRRRGLKP
jgi:hypothetical protein